jgi:hypothetical protein
MNKPFQHLHVERVINRGLFGHEFKADDAPDVEKQVNIALILDFDVCGFFTLGEFFDLHSMNWRMASGSH